jgi:hypothetical protein
MPVPWLQILDAVIGFTDLARSRKIRKLSQANEEPMQQLEATGRAGTALGGLETRLAGVVVAALKEAFERDNRRLDLERAQLDAERERAERALQLEIRRQAGDREIGRLRLVAAVAVASWLGTLFFSTKLMGGAVGPRVALGGGWLLLLMAFALAFVGQSRVSDALSRSENAPIASGAPGGLAVWFIVAGLGLIGLAVLVA